MAAPAAPVIRVRQDGVRVYVRWQPVTDATDYKLYVKDLGGSYGLEDDIADDELGSDGWFFDITSPQSGPVVVKVTALNAGAEESGASNEVQVNVQGAGGGNHPTPALDKRRKGVI